MDLSELVDTNLGEQCVTYTDRDAMLYALAVGATASDLSLVYERDLQVLPTYALVIGRWAVAAAGDLGAYDRLRTLHASQTLTMRSTLPPEGKVLMTARVSGVWDKQKASLVDIEVESEQFTATYSIFLPELGGWGGPRGESARRGIPDRWSWSHEVPTWTDQAALYRLTGDRHPLHIDPEVARRSGFDRPILHGMCTLGSTALAIARATAVDLCSLRELSARLAAPVYPGDLLRVSGSPVGAGALAFEASVGNRRVLSDCHAAFGVTPQ